MKIRSRMLLYLSVFYFLILATGLSIQFFTYATFSRYLYGSVKEIFDTTVGSFVNSVKNIEQLSINIFADEQTQNFLGLESRDTHDFSWVRKREALIHQLSFYTRTNPYIKEIILVDNKENTYFVNIGSYDSINFSELIIQKIRDDTKALSGKVLWSETGNEMFPVVLSRQINRIGDFSSPSIGQLFILIDIDRLLEETLSQVNHYSIQTSINFKNRQFFSQLGTKGDEFRQLLEVKRYDTLQYSDEQHFSVLVQSPDKEWDFLFLIPVRELFQKLARINRIVYSIYGLLFILFAVLAVRFTRSITSPIIALSQEMKEVEDRGFDVSESLILPDRASEEVKLLFHEFYQMIEKIDMLVNRNLKQQLVLQQSQLEALSYQLNPHFLYNTLDSLYWMAEMNGDPQMGSMIKSLSELLRSSLQKAGPVISVKEQLDLLNNYFFIQKMRMKERLDFQINVDHSMYSAEIPRFTIQPLVENSIKYSLENQDKPCRIVVSIKENLPDNGLDLLIRDNGPGLSEEIVGRSDRTGIGIENLRKRLNILYGESSKLTHAINEWGGTDMMIFIPYQKKDETLKFEEPAV